MTDKLTSIALNESTSIEVSEDKTKVSIFHGIDRNKAVKIGEFRIEEVWDMIRDSLIIGYFGFTSNPGLFRRKEEATAAIMCTNKIYLKEETE